MKLKNKKTGEIGRLKSNYKCYNSLAELCEEWEDYEEPKEYWFIGYDAQIESICEKDSDEGSIEADKEIGNYFETKEEAEKAVERLKAWKRLKGKGFRFVDFEEKDRGCIGDLAIYAHIEPDFSSRAEYEEFNQYLDLLFGGEK